MPEPEPHTGDFDILGAVLCAATFGLIISGLESAVHGDSPVVSGAIVALGIAIAFIFVRRELGEARPIMPVDLLGTRVFALSTLGAFTAFIASMTIILSLPFRLEHGFGFSAIDQAVSLLARPLADLPALGA